MRRGISGAVALSLFLTMAACVPPPAPYKMSRIFAASDFAPWAGPGPATIDGQAFMKTVGGDVKTCAGNRVYLMPANAYNDEALAHGRGGVRVEGRDPRADEFLRTSICDASGKFSFEKVPAQTWYVLTDVTWGAVQGDEIERQGGMLQQKVIAKPGITQAILTDADFVR